MTKAHSSTQSRLPPSPLTRPLHSSAAAVLFLALLTLSVVRTASHACSKLESKPYSSSCPPFTTSTPSFPFSPTPGCGHPSFQIQCSSPHSIITIKNMSFSLLRYESYSSSLLLSPLPSNKSSSNGNCNSSHFPSIPNQPINFSGSPFRVSDWSCSRLSVLKPCPSLNLPNCSHCPRECKLIKNPAQIIHACGSGHHLVAGQGCQGDILGFLDKLLSMGILVEWDENGDNYFSNCTACQTNKGDCGFNSSDPQKQFVCFQDQNQTLPPWIRHNGPNQIAMFSLSFGSLSLLAVVLIVSLILRSKRNSLVKEDPTILYLRRHRSATLLPPIFTYEELESSTNGFDPNRKIGDGGFGSVYLGQLSDGRIVAVKHLHKPHPTDAAFSIKAFCNEILILSSITHPNMVKILGYCSDPRALLLVHDYVSNGTLAEHLHGIKGRKCFLTWKLRVEMALQTAMAMEYLHFSVVPPIVHRDITSSNIFVEKDMRVKLGDFGLSRIMGNSASLGGSSGSGCVWTGPQGTPGYLDPDYHRSFLLTEKSDVYSFGVVLLELVTGMKAVDGRREKGEVALADLVVEKIQMRMLEQVVDPVLKEFGGGGDVVEGIAAIAELAFRCVAADKDDRPDAKEVVAELRRICSDGGSVSVGVSRASSTSANV